MRRLWKTHKTSHVWSLSQHTVLFPHMPTVALEGPQACMQNHGPTVGGGRPQFVDTFPPCVANPRESVPGTRQHPLDPQRTHQRSEFCVRHFCVGPGLPTVVAPEHSDPDVFTTVQQGQHDALDCGYGVNFTQPPIVPAISDQKIT